MTTSINDFWWATLLALSGWGAIAFLIGWRVRSGKVFKGITAAKQNIYLGLILVVVSMVPPGVSWFKYMDFKEQRQAESQETAQMNQRLQADTDEKKCAALKAQNQECAPKKDQQRQEDDGETLYTIMAKIVDMIGVFVGFLGGALGVNILSEGLFRRDKTLPEPLEPSPMYVKRTITYEGGKIHHETIMEYRPSKPE